MIASDAQREVARALCWEDWVSCAGGIFRSALLHCTAPLRRTDTEVLQWLLALSSLGAAAFALHLPLVRQERVCAGVIKVFLPLICAAAVVGGFSLFFELDEGWPARFLATVSAVVCFSVVWKGFRGLRVLLGTALGAGVALLLLNVVELAGLTEQRCPWLRPVNSSAACRSVRLLLAGATMEHWRWPALESAGCSVQAALALLRTVPGFRAMVTLGTQLLAMQALETGQPALEQPPGSMCSPWWQPALRKQHLTSVAAVCSGCVCCSGACGV